MRHLLIVLMLLVAAGTSAQQIYRTVDKDGNVIFTDVPGEGAEKIELKETMTINSLGTEPSSPVTTATPEPEQVIPYKSFSILNPADDESIRDNAGNVNVTVSIEPMLQSGHEVVVYLDGKEKMKGTGSAFNLENIDRGTHQLRASVKDPNGHILISSKSTTFHLQRQSVIKR